MTTVNTDHTCLHSLAATVAGQTFCLYFDKYDTLLQTRAALAKESNITLAEEGSSRILFHSAEEAVNTVRLWAEAAGPSAKAPRAMKAPRAANDTRPKNKAEQLIEMLYSPTGVTADEVAEAFGVKKNSATSRISVESRRRGLHVVRDNDHYRIAS